MIGLYISLSLFKFYNYLYDFILGFILRMNFEHFQQNFNNVAKDKGKKFWTDFIATIKMLITFYVHNYEDDLHKIYCFTNYPEH